MSLTNFRNYRRLELALPPGPLVFLGDNAQGKTNLLEALYLLATSKSPRTIAERELVSWEALEGEMPVCRLVGDLVRGERKLRLELVLRPYSPARRAPEGEGGLAPGPAFEKLVKVNGVVKRAQDLVGQLKVVLFSTSDIDIIGGAPSLRRRFLDALLAQADRQYLRSFQRYQHVLQQRNSLLKLVRERRSSPEELAFWDQELVEWGSYLILHRRQAVSHLDPLVRALHLELSGGRERVEMGYEAPFDLEPGEPPQPGDAIEGVKEAFRSALAAQRSREIEHGMSLVGPHRDDVKFWLNGWEAGRFGSRAQHRTLVLSLKLGEARFLQEEGGEEPVMLLDDVLSELDEGRRGRLLEAALTCPQAFITATDLDRFPSIFLARAALFRVKEGQVMPSPWGRQ